MTSEQIVRSVMPRAQLDFHSLLDRDKVTKWYIRLGTRGPALSQLCDTPKVAWMHAYKHLLALKVLRPGSPTATQKE